MTQRHTKDPPIQRIETVHNLLRLMAEQARAYERTLPPSNHQARLAIASLSEMIRQALAEVADIENGLTNNSPAQHPLSPREAEVLSLAACGLTNKEIAYRLGISDRTVQFHMNSVFNKTSTESRTEAATFALQNGWIKV